MTKETQRISNSIPVLVPLQALIEWMPIIGKECVAAYLSLFWRQGQNDYTWVSVKKLSQDIKCSVALARSAVKTLSENNLITVEERAGKTSRIYVNKDPKRPTPTKTDRGKRWSCFKSTENGVDSGESTQTPIEIMPPTEIDTPTKTDRGTPIENDRRTLEKEVSKETNTPLAPKEKTEEGDSPLGNKEYKTPAQCHVFPAERSEEPTALSCEPCEPPNQPSVAFPALGGQAIQPVRSGESLGLFEAVAALYPRAEELKKAKQVWLNDHLHLRHEEIVAGIERHKAHNRQWHDHSQGKNRVPYLWRFLDGERWVEIPDGVTTTPKTTCAPGTHEFDDRRVDMAGTAHGCCLNCKKWHPIGNAQGVA